MSRTLNQEIRVDTLRRHPTEQPKPDDSATPSNTTSNDQHQEPSSPPSAPAIIKDVSAPISDTQLPAPEAALVKIFDQPSHSERPLEFSTPQKVDTALQQMTAFEPLAPPSAVLDTALILRYALTSAKLLVLFLIAYVSTRHTVLSQRRTATALAFGQSGYGTLAQLHSSRFREQTMTRQESPLGSPAIGPAQETPIPSLNRIDIIRHAAQEVSRVVTAAPFGTSTQSAQPITVATATQQDAVGIPTTVAQLALLSPEPSASSKVPVEHSKYEQTQEAKAEVAGPTLVQLSHSAISSPAAISDRQTPSATLVADPPSPTRSGSNRQVEETEPLLPKTGASTSATPIETPGASHEETPSSSKSLAKSNSLSAPSMAKAEVIGTSPETRQEVVLSKRGKSKDNERAVPDLSGELHASAADAVESPRPSARSAPAVAESHWDQKPREVRRTVPITVRPSTSREVAMGEAAKVLHLMDRALKDASRMTASSRELR